jgi:hypothetical protein
VVFAVFFSGRLGFLQILVEIFHLANCIARIISRRASGQTSGSLSTIAGGQQQKSSLTGSIPASIVLKNRT